MMGMPHRHLCLHGHFYQPPREDPFTHVMPDEIGAGQYRNFNEKITAECYRPNVVAHNFELMSFDLGPTLAAWLERYARDVYDQIIEADRAAVRATGVGTALAQAYNHTILPLATRRDKRTQIVWGIADFTHRFGRAPEGMWLGETAVDMETMDLLAEHGIRYTILAPWQAAHSVDTSEPYWVRLANGRRMDVFFYNGPISGDVSFNDYVTMNADQFVTGYLPNYLNWEKEQQGTDQLLLVSTDGELYGHHKPFRDLFLSRMLRHSAPAFGYEVTSLGRYLRSHAPQREARLYVPSAWSCAHGVARWNAGCDCTEGNPGLWKPGLRAALTALAAKIDALYERHATALADPWDARDHYIELRSGWATPGAFWSRHGRHGRRPGKEAVSVRTWHLLEAEYCAQASFTSCGWFFEDLDRIEPRIVLNYARCAISHVWQALHVNLQDDFLNDLEDARSWRTHQTAAQLYRRLPPVPVAEQLPPPAAATDEPAA